jgi:alanine racemase
MTSTYRCWAEIDLDALRANLQWLRVRVGPRVKIMAVVKADAYGHGLKQIAALLMQGGADAFGVANLAEARAIRSVGRGWPVLMLGACIPGEVETCVKEGVIPTISSVGEVAAFAAAARKLRRSVDVHLKVDTGMGRLGAAPDEALAVAQEILRHDALKLHGLYTHFSSAEDDAEFSVQQAAAFSRVVAQLKNAGIQPALLHANNSAAILHEPGTTLDLVRPGLLIYGIVPTGSRRLAPPAPELRPALSWHCRVALVKEIARGTPLSYGRAFIAPRKMRVATITAGYGDGWLRAGAGHGAVLIRGRRCVVLGRVTMDQMLVDLAHAPDAQPGDIATLIGAQGDDSITAAELAKWCGTIPWEVLTNITYRVPRLYRGSHAA